MYYEAYASESLARSREKRLKSHGNAVRELKKRIGIVPPNSRPKSGAGFTLMEILISAAIFGIALVIAVGLFTSVSTAQRRVQVMIKLQGDTRYLMEVLAQEIRINGIDYSWYTNGRVNGIYVILNSFDRLYKIENAAHPTDEIVTTDSSGVRRVYRKIETSSSSGKYFIGVCAQDSNDTAQDSKCTIQSLDGDKQTKDNLPNFEPITPENISVDRFDAWLSPSSDPYAPQPSSVMDCRREKDSDASLSDTSYIPAQPTAGFNASNGTCTCMRDIDCRGQACYGGIFNKNVPANSVLGVCVNPNEQPRVTIVMTSRNTDADPGRQQTTTLQTTVSSRTYKR